MLSNLYESTCCGTVGFASYRPRLGVVPAVGRGGSKLCSLRPARRGKLLFVHRDVELGNHPHFPSYDHCLSLSLPESHEHPSPPLSPGAMAPPFPTHLCSLVLLVALFSAKSLSFPPPNFKFFLGCACHLFCCMLVFLCFHASIHPSIYSN